MKKLLTIAALFLLACNTIPEQGFTNKAEAKNEMVNGVKEGKWVEYIDSTNKHSKDTNAAYYDLIIYKEGKPFGVAHSYYRGGKIRGERHYIDGKLNGSETFYYKSGKLKQEDNWKNDSINGEMKIYYESGKLEMEMTWVNFKNTGLKEYYENGQIESEIPPGRNRIEKKYYEDGKIKQEIALVGDSENGPYKEYYHNGKLQKETIYINDSATSVKSYDSTGNEIK